MGLVREPLFAGPQSLRVPGEWRAFWTCMLAAPLVIALAGLVFSSVSISEFVLLEIDALLAEIAR